jgi:supervillin
MSSICSEHEREFFSILKKQSNDTDDKIVYRSHATSVDEDERYESLISDTNIVYKVANAGKSINSSSSGGGGSSSSSASSGSGSGSGSGSNSSSENDEPDDYTQYELKPVRDYWGGLLSYNMLDENEVFVFDFGSEVYVWNGRSSSNVKKKAGLLLAKKLYEDGYDYTSCLLTPLRPRLDAELQREQQPQDLGGYFKSSKSRPKWTLFGRQSQNVETVLFREKFIDWPSQSHSTQLKKLAYNASHRCGGGGVAEPTASGTSSGNSSAPSTPVSSVKRMPPHLLHSSSKTPALFNYKAVEGARVLAKDEEKYAVNLMLEGSSLGRGRHWHDVVERRSFDILTEQIRMWQINDNQLAELEASSYGEMCAAYTYVIKWHYKIAAVGFRNLRGEASLHAAITGRDRYALFFWQGERSSQNEKGVSALLSLDILTSASSLPSSSSTQQHQHQQQQSSLAASIGSNYSTDGSQSQTPAEDRRQAPHVHVLQYREMPAFCQLFDGGMIVLSGAGNGSARVEEKDRRRGNVTGEWRMFELRGELPEEAHLIELEQPGCDCLRSRTSFLFFNVAKRTFIVWHGCLSDELHRHLMMQCVKKLANR